MSDNQKIRPRLWISYTWTGKEERDFSYLLPKLKEENIEAIYDSLPVESHIRLSQRIVHRLLSVNFDGWLYVLTQQVVLRACADELIESIDRTRAHLGPEFPMVGLLCGIDLRSVPSPLKVRPCFSVGDPQWRQRLYMALRPPPL